MAATQVLSRDVNTGTTGDKRFIHLYIKLNIKKYGSGVNTGSSNVPINAGGYEDKIYVKDIIKKGIKIENAYYWFGTRYFKILQ